MSEEHLNHSEVDYGCSEKWKKDRWKDYNCNEKSHVGQKRESMGEVAMGVVNMVFIVLVFSFTITNHDHNRVTMTALDWPTWNDWVVVSW